MSRAVHPAGDLPPDDGTRRWSVWKLRHGSFKLVAVCDSRREAEVIRNVIPLSIVWLGRPADPTPVPGERYFKDQSSDWGGIGTE